MLNWTPPDTQLMANLTSEFYSHLDDRDYDAALQAFAHDGIWFRRGQQVIGHQAIRAAMASRPRDFHTRHIVSNVRVYQTDADKGRVIFYLTGHPYVGEIAEGSHVPLPQAHIVATYQDAMRREGSRWVITEKRLLTIGFKDQMKLP